MEDIGEKIKQERKKKGLSQKDLANQAHISNTYLSDIEVGRTKPSLKTLQNLAKALEVDAREFL